MRNITLLMSATAVALTPLISVRAQTVGIAPGGPADAPAAGIATAQASAFRDYVIGAGTPSYAVPGDVTEGAILPEAGVRFYEVPQSFAVTPYRYTVVNGETVLVEPHTRRVVQMID